MTAARASTSRKRLAIIGGGSSGLISLKYALEALPDWDIVCFEKSDRTIGCWGQPYPGFVSTSTKYTTQFACYPVTDASTNAQHERTFEEFFREDEYGQYLQSFVNHFGLTPHIQLNTQVVNVAATEDQRWQLTLEEHSHGAIQAVNGDDSSGSHESSTPARHALRSEFDAVIVCTGLAAQPKQVDSSLPCLGIRDLHGQAGLGHIQHRRIVVLGGGESAVDYAVRLSRPELQNHVYLSLASGIRVSPRYHPIRGVPSDFLRNRLMLSIHEDLRNWIGQRFVEARIRYQELFERWFPARSQVAAAATDQQLVDRQKYWAYLLTQRAKDQLFNMFHNKSDGFLEAVAKGEIQIVGLPVDEAYQQCHSFDSEDLIDVQADLLVPAIGYRSTLGTLFSQPTSVRDFYLGCVHQTHPNLYLVGFARPIIGNIPTISEMQARYVTALIRGECVRPENIAQLHANDMQRHSRQFPKLNRDAIYPVEMFPYCDRLSRLLQAYPSLMAARSLKNWVKLQLCPATTMAYFLKDGRRRKQLSATRVYMPGLLIGLLLMLKPLDWSYKLARWLTGRA